MAESFLNGVRGLPANAFRSAGRSADPLRQIAALYRGDGFSLGDDGVLICPHLQRQTLDPFPGILYEIEKNGLQGRVVFRLPNSDDTVPYKDVVFLGSQRRELLRKIHEEKDTGTGFSRFTFITAIPNIPVQSSPLGDVLDRLNYHFQGGTPVFDKAFAPFDVPSARDLFETVRVVPKIIFPNLRSLTNFEEGGDTRWGRSSGSHRLVLSYRACVHPLVGKDWKSGAAFDIHVNGPTATWSWSPAQAATRQPQRMNKRQLAG